MPNVTIKCKWCDCVIHDGPYDAHWVHVCLAHENECEKNPANKPKVKGPFIAVDLSTGKDWSGKIELYKPTDEDKYLACTVNGFLRDNNAYITNHFANWIEDKHILGLQKLFKRLGLI